MDEVFVSTTVYAPREEVFAFLLDLEGYPAYSKYLKAVETRGDGGPGTTYTMTFGWWKLTYRATSEVVSVEETHSIDWQVTKDIDARGHWRLEDVDPVAEAEGDHEERDDQERATGESRGDGSRDRAHATRVELRIEFDPDSVHVGAIDLPAFVSLDWVIDRVVPRIQDEAERVLRRIVADLEGEPREVELEVHEEPESI